MSIFQQFPSEKELLEKHKPEKSHEVYKVNNHLHTPYSFSAFQDIPQIFKMGKEENITALGINDFYTTAGYEDFYQLSIRNKIFPLFNIEFIGLIKDLQEKNQLVNDPKNPGRSYFTGKGLNYPVNMSDKSAGILNDLKAHSEDQVKRMIAKANKFFMEQDLPLQLDFDEIKQHYARELVRERHVAMVIRDKISQQVSSEKEMSNWLTKLYGEKKPLADLSDNPSLENEIRGNLLKKGGKAFVPEDDDAFLSLEQIRDIVIDAGGIPTYPVLLDNEKGEFTDFERDWSAMHDYLRKLKVGAVELIPGRNSIEVLTEFVRFFNERNFIITFGTEHNTPALKPLTVKCRHNFPLTAELERISWEGVAVIAAHQYRKANGREGFISSKNEPKPDSKEDFVKLGKAVINEFLLQ
jgi:hypothetical protein